MEHLEPDEIGEVLEEWKRIAKPECKYIFSIATWGTIRKVYLKNGTRHTWQLHPTQKSPDWWKDILEKHGFTIDKYHHPEDKGKIRIKAWGTIKK